MGEKISNNNQRSTVSSVKGKASDKQLRWAENVSTAATPTFEFQGRASQAKEGNGQRPVSATLPLQGEAKTSREKPRARARVGGHHLIPGQKAKVAKLLAELDAKNRKARRNKAIAVKTEKIQSEQQIEKERVQEAYEARLQPEEDRNAQNSAEQGQTKESRSTRRNRLRRQRQKELKAQQSGVNSGAQEPGKNARKKAKIRAEAAKRAQEAQEDREIRTSSPDSSPNGKSPSDVSASASPVTRTEVEKKVSEEPQVNASTDSEVTNRELGALRREREENRARRKKKAGGNNDAKVKLVDKTEKPSKESSQLTSTVLPDENAQPNDGPPDTSKDAALARKLAQQDQFVVAELPTETGETPRLEEISTSSEEEQKRADSSSGSSSEEGEGTGNDVTSGVNFEVPKALESSREKVEEENSDDVDSEELTASSGSNDSSSTSGKNPSNSSSSSPEVVSVDGSTSSAAKSKGGPETGDSDDRLDALPVGPTTALGLTKKQWGLAGLVSVVAILAIAGVAGGVFHKQIGNVLKIR